MPNVSKYRASLPDAVTHTLRVIGSNVKIARKRRRWPLGVLAEKLNTSVPTIRRLEAGDPGVGTGLFMASLWALGLLEDMRFLADPDRDEVGKTLELARLPKSVHSPARSVNDF